MFPGLCSNFPLSTFKCTCLTMFTKTHFNVTGYPMVTTKSLHYLFNTLVWKRILFNRLFKSLSNFLWENINLVSVSTLFWKKHHDSIHACMFLILLCQVIPWLLRNRCIIRLRIESDIAYCSTDFSFLWTISYRKVNLVKV